MDALTKAFLEWANGKGYDTAHAYNQNESRWVFLSPMTADVYEAWRCGAGLRESHDVIVKRGHLDCLSGDIESMQDWLDAARSWVACFKNGAMK